MFIVSYFYQYLKKILIIYKFFFFLIIALKAKKRILTVYKFFNAQKDIFKLLVQARQWNLYRMRRLNNSQKTGVLLNIHTDWERKRT